MNPTAARALEALIGAAPGAVLGGVAGAAAYEPADARSWMLPDGQVGGRSLTEAEKAERTKWIIRGALGGAALGAGGALGGSKVRETLIRRQDLRDSRAVAQAYLPAIRSRAAKYKSTVWSARDLGQYDAGKARRAEELLAHLEGLARKAPRDAARRRAGQVFRGQTYLLNEAGDEMPHPKNLGKERVHSGFADLGFSGSVDDTRTFDELVANGISKTAARALLEEMLKVSAALTRPLGLGAAISKKLLQVGEAAKPRRVIGAQAHAGVSSFMPKTIPSAGAGSAATPMAQAPTKLVGGMGTSVSAARSAASKAKP